MAELTTGDAAPLFSLPVDDGGTVRLAELRGKIVVLFFYPQDNTETCTAEAIDFSRHRDAFTKAGAVVVGISPDSLRKHANFRKKHGLTTPLAADEAREAIEAYGVWGEKTMFGRKYMGVIRSTFLIDREGKIARIWRKVRVPGHVEEVLESAKAL
jgi:thioredoxin-dependent peroxiredoxin